MFVELGTSFMLWTSRPENLTNTAVTTGIILVVVIWASTFFLQVPQHGKLSLGFDAAAHASLVSSNWIRTIAWSLRGVLTAWMVWKVM